MPFKGFLDFFSTQFSTTYEQFGVTVSGVCFDDWDFDHVELEFDNYLFNKRLQQMDPIIVIPPFCF